jgi:cobalt/nickel transport system permease protein
MHIPDGYLGPQTYGTLWGAMLPIWYGASRQVKRTLQAKQVPLLAIGAAFTFVLMMFNIPLPGGTTGHAVGSTLVAIVLGPWVAVIAVSIALIVQALLFGDGGVTAFGANCFNMAFVMPLSGYLVFRLIGTGGSSQKRRILAAAIAGYVSLNLAALCAGVELGLQPLLAHRPDGTPLYCPYSLKIAVPAMAAGHLLVFGWVEAIVTGLVVGYLLKAEPKLVNR